jgi:hypothetical protein
MPLPRLLLLIIFAVAAPLQPSRALTPWTSKPSFQDAPFHALVAAFASRDKLVVNHRGVARRLWATDGPAGMGRPDAFIGETVAVTRTCGTASSPPPPSSPSPPCAFDAAGASSTTQEYLAGSSAPSWLTSTRYSSDGVAVLVTALAGATEARGFLLNVTVVAPPPLLLLLPLSVSLNVAVDFVAGLAESSSSSSAAALFSGPRRVLQVLDTVLPSPGAVSLHPVPASVSSAGHLPGYLPHAVTAAPPGAAWPAWAATSAINGPYPGQANKVGTDAAPLTYVFPVSANGTYILGVGLVDIAGNGAAVVLAVDGAQFTLDVGVNALVHYLRVSDADGNGLLSVVFSAGGHVEGLFLYNVSASGAEGSSEGAASFRLTSPYTCGVVGSASDPPCPGMTPCNGTSFTPTQVWRWNFESENGTLSDAGGTGYLDLNLHEPTNCSDNGPVVLFPSYVPVTWCGGQNQYWAHGSGDNGSPLINALSGQCLTCPPSGYGNATQEVCAYPVPPTQQWAYDNATGFLQCAATSFCLDAAPSPPLSQLWQSVDCGSSEDVLFGEPFLTADVTLTAEAPAASFFLFLPHSLDNNATADFEPSQFAADAEEAWAALLAPAVSSFAVPDPDVAYAIEVQLQTLLMSTETQTDGLRVTKSPVWYYGSDPYDTFRATLALNLFNLGDVSRDIALRQAQRLCQDGTFEMWESGHSGSCPTTPLYITQGLAANALLTQYLYTRDEAYLSEVYPALNASALATSSLRQACNCSGFMPDCVGDGGLPSGKIFVQQSGGAAGSLAAMNAAKVLGFAEDAARAGAEWASFAGTLRASIAANVVPGFENFTGPLLPMYPGDTSFACCGWGAVDIVYPFPIVNNASSPLALNLLNMFLSPAFNDTYGLPRHLGYSTQPWAYLTTDLAHWLLEIGDGARAWSLFSAILENASPAVSFYEEFETGPMPKTLWGGIPDVWAVAEILHLFHALMARLQLADRSNLASLAGVHLAQGVPDAWRCGGCIVALGPSVLETGPVSLNLTYGAGGGTGTVLVGARVSVVPLSGFEGEYPTTLQTVVHVGSWGEGAGGGGGGKGCVSVTPVSPLPPGASAVCGPGGGPDRQQPAVLVEAPLASYVTGGGLEVLLEVGLG